MDIHILLKATEIIWFVWLSPFLLTDYPSKSSVISSIAITIGAICFSWTTIPQNDIEFGIIVSNLLSALFQPFQILFLRRAIRILTVEESETRRMDGIDLMTKAEMTLIYLIYGLLIIFPFQLGFEGTQGWKMINDQFGATCNWSLISIGGGLLLLYQWNVVSLTREVEPILIGIGQQSEQLWRFIVSLFLGGITLQICGCVVDDAQDGDNCKADMGMNDDTNNMYPTCPCWQQPDDVFTGKGYISHWFGLLLISLGFIFYCYLKAKNLHVTNVNIFRPQR